MKAEIILSENNYTYLITIKHLEERYLFTFHLEKIESDKITFGLYIEDNRDLYFSNIASINIPFNFLCYEIVELDRVKNEQYFLCVKKNNIYSGQILETKNVSFNERYVYEEERYDV